MKSDFSKNENVPLSVSLLTCHSTVISEGIFTTTDWIHLDTAKITIYTKLGHTQHFNAAES